MNNEKKEMTQEEAEQDFQNKVFGVFSEKLEGVHRDKDGFIVIPRASMKKNHNNPSSNNAQN